MDQMTLAVAAGATGSDLAYSECSTGAVPSSVVATKCAEGLPVADV